MLSYSFAPPKPFPTRSTKLCSVAPTVRGTTVDYTSSSLVNVGKILYDDDLHLAAVGSNFFNLSASIDMMYAYFLKITALLSEEMVWIERKLSVIYGEVTDCI